MHADGRPARIGRRLSRLLGAFLLSLVLAHSAEAAKFTDGSFQTPAGAVGSRYYHLFEGRDGCGPALPYQFRVLSDSLPPGLTLSPGGLVSGVPTQQGAWTFWMEINDQDPPSASWCAPRKSERQFTISIGPKGSVPDAAGPATSGGSVLSVAACDLPVVGNVCDAVTGAVTKVAAGAGEFVMRGVTAWVTNAAVWVAAKVGELIEKTTTPDLTASWFEGQYGAMVAVAGALALLMLMLAVIQSVIRQDIGLLIRAAFGYLPMAFILAGVAIAGTGLLVAITDDMSSAVVSSLGTEQSDNLLQTVGDAYKDALDEGSGIPLFGVFLGAIILAIGAFVLWLEMIIRDAAIYICVFFLPLTFVAMIWPATGRWARRLVELLVAVILAKFVIVAILTLATAAIANTDVVQGDGNTFERMIAGSAILVLAAWSPFALLRMIPMMEVAAASVSGQRSSMSAAAGSAGIHSPAGYMRQAMDRTSRPSTSPAYATTGGTTYPHARTTEASNDRGTHGSPPPVREAREEMSATPSSSPISGSSGGTVYPTGRPQSAPSTGHAESGSPAATEAPPPSRPAAPPTPPTQRPRPPDPPQGRRPPTDGDDS
ncbi:MAG: type IV secretion system protein [Actinomycetota bacterium]|nr:type IV secretion system protein [Actinomycetota bacterium]